jgi:hypothetical protein
MGSRLIRDLRPSFFDAVAIDPHMGADLTYPRPGAVRTTYFYLLKAAQ